MISSEMIVYKNGKRRITFKEVLVNQGSVLLGDKHGRMAFPSAQWMQDDEKESALRGFLFNLKFQLEILPKKIREGRAFPPL